MAAADSVSTQIVWLFVLAAPVACVAWTITHEELFSELHAWCLHRSRECRSLYARKFFYLFTCEYCFSHWVALVALAGTGYRLLLDDWRGVVIAFFSLVGIANLYMSLFGRLRIDIKGERVEIAVKEEQLAEPDNGAPSA
jgi:hypothetical protein